MTRRQVRGKTNTFLRRCARASAKGTKAELRAVLFGLHNEFSIAAEARRCLANEDAKDIFHFGSKMSLSWLVKTKPTP